MGLTFPDQPQQEPKIKRKSQAHRDFVRDFACLVCGSKSGIHVHHVRLGSDGGTGLKPSDRYVVPLCSTHHDEVHKGELSFQRKYMIDLLARAAEFVKASPKRRELEMML